MTVRDGVRFLECIGDVEQVDDASELVSTCAAQRTNRLLIDSATLPDAFFDVSTRFAGEFLQKLYNHRIRVAAIFDGADHGVRFGEFLNEARRGNAFRAFFDREEALNWLSSAER